MNEQRTHQLESELRDHQLKIDRLTGDNEELQRRLQVAEDAAAAERRSGNKIRGELTRARAEIERIKRETSPDYDPRDGDPCLQKGKGAIPLGNALGLHATMEHVEAVEKLFGLGPTQDEQLRLLNILPEDHAQLALDDPKKLLLPDASDGVELTPREGVRACALVVWAGRLVRRLAPMIVRPAEEPEGGDGLGELFVDATAARQAACFLGIITNLDFMRFSPVHKQATKYAKEAEAANALVVHRILREAALEEL